MNKFIFLLLISQVFGCRAPISEMETKVDSMAECEKAAREYLAVPRFVKPYGNTSPTPKPPLKVRGVSLFRKINDDFLIIKVDAETQDGKSTETSAQCRRYTGEGKTYLESR